MHYLCVLIIHTRIDTQRYCIHTRFVFMEDKIQLTLVLADTVEEKLHGPQAVSPSAVNINLWLVK